MARIDEQKLDEAIEQLRIAWHKLDANYGEGEDFDDKRSTITNHELYHVMVLVDDVRSKLMKAKDENDQN